MNEVQYQLSLGIWLWTIVTGAFALLLIIEWHFLRRRNPDDSLASVILSEMALPAFIRIVVYAIIAAFTLLAAAPSLLGETKDTLSFLGGVFASAVALVYWVQLTQKAAELRFKSREFWQSRFVKTVVLSTSKLGNESPDLDARAAAFRLMSSLAEGAHNEDQRDIMHSLAGYLRTNATEQAFYYASSKLRIDIAAAAETLNTISQMRDCPNHSLDLRSVYLRGISWDGIRLPHALLQEANLDEAQLKHANFDYAKLSKASLLGLNAETVSMRNSDLSGAKFGASDVRSSKFLKCDLADSTLTETDFTDAELDGVSFDRSQCTGTIFQHVTFKSASFVGAVFQATDIEELSAAKLQLSLTQMAATKSSNEKALAESGSAEAV